MSQQPVSSPDSARFQAVSCRVEVVDARLSIVVSPRSAVVRPLETDAATILARCAGAASLAEHAVRVQPLVEDDIRDAVPAILLRLVEQGFLERADAWRSRSVAEPTTAHERAAAIEDLAVVTADRPALLDRALSSYAEHLTRHGRSGRVWVIDASTDPRSDRQREVASPPKPGGLVCHHVDAAFRSRARAHAIAAGLSPGDADRLTARPERPGTIGTNRNMALLATAGRPVLMFDDDTVCDVWRTPWSGPDLCLASRIDRRETRPFAAREAALAAAPRVDVDLLALHERVLGARCADLLASCSGTPDAADASPVLLEAIQTERARVRATWMGIAGDAAAACPYPLLFLRGDTRDRLARDLGQFTLALTSREVLRSVPGLTVSDEPWFMTYCAAIDGREWVPPFLPMGTNEDGLFGWTLRACCPDAFIAQLPNGIVHDSSRSAAMGEDVPSARNPPLADLVRLVASPLMRALLGPSPAERLSALGRELVAAGTLGLLPFRALLAEQVAAVRAGHLRAAELMLASDYPYPPFWRQAVRRYQQAILASLERDGFYLPSEFSRAATIDEGLGLTQREFRRFGRLLQAWPSLWALSVRDPLLP